MTRVLVAAASAVVRAGLEAVVGTSPELTVVGSTGTGENIGERIEAVQADVVLIEVERGSDDPALLPPIAGTVGPPGFVVLTDRLDAAEAGEVLRRGARALLPREAEADTIVAAVVAVAAGLVVLDPAGAAALLPHTSSRRQLEDTHLFEALTPREIEVLSMLAEGAGNKEIARRLSISEHTVKFHVGSILAKLDASSRTEAVTLGIRKGLIML